MKVPFEVAATFAAELVPLKTVGRDDLPVVRDTQSLPHDASIGAMQPERVLHVRSSGVGNQTEDVAYFMHCLGDNAVVGVVVG